MHKLEFCGVVKEVDKRIDESVLHWFGHIERRENDMIAIRVYMRVCVVTRLVV